MGFRIYAAESDFVEVEMAEQRSAATKMVEVPVFRSSGSVIRGVDFTGLGSSQALTPCGEQCEAVGCCYDNGLAFSVQIF